MTSHDWLGDPSTALGSIIVMSIWQSVSFQMIIVLAALQSVPTELYEAASLDRASNGLQFINVTVPGIRNTLIFVALHHHHLFLPALRPGVPPEPLRER